MTASRPRRWPSRRVLVVTDSDSYVKYGATIAEQLPGDWTSRLIVVRSGVLPSSGQLAAAVDGTAFAGQDLEILDLAGVERLLNQWRPDVLLLTARGYTVQAVVELVDNVPMRPVLVAGLAGIAYPVLPLGLHFRRPIDVFIVHSRRELAAFEAKCAELGLVHDLQLGTIPYATDASAVEPVEPANRVVFAAQAQVPAAASQRRAVVDTLIETARAHPEWTVVLKVRAAAGEAQTHLERLPYAELLDERDDVPPNLVIEDGPMRAHLARAVGLVTVSSTAILEAIAADVPAIALDDFGVGAEQINLVLQDSGLLGSRDDLIAGNFRKPNPEWLENNYFHDPGENTWVSRVEELLERRSFTGLPPYLEPPKSLIRSLRKVADRHVTFRAHRSPLYSDAERFFVVAVTGAYRVGRRLARKF